MKLVILKRMFLNTVIFCILLLPSHSFANKPSLIGKYDLDGDGVADVVEAKDGILEIRLSTKATNKPYVINLPIDHYPDGATGFLSATPVLDRIDVSFPNMGKPNYYMLSIAYNSKEEKYYLRQLESFFPCQTCEDLSTQYCYTRIDKPINGNLNNENLDFTLDNSTCHTFFEGVSKAKNHQSLQSFYVELKKSHILASLINKKDTADLLKKFNAKDKQNKQTYLKMVNLLAYERNYNAATILLNEINKVSQPNQQLMSDLCEEVKDNIIFEKNKKDEISWEDKKGWLLVDARRICHLH